MLKCLRKCKFRHERKLNKGDYKSNRINLVTCRSVKHSMEILIIIQY